MVMQVHHSIVEARPPCAAEMQPRRRSREPVSNGSSTSNPKSMRGSRSIAQRRGGRRASRTRAGEWARPRTAARDPHRRQRYRRRAGPSHPRRIVAYLRRTGPGRRPGGRAMAIRRRHHPGQDRHHGVCLLRSVAHSIPGMSTTRPAAPAAARPRQWPRAWCWAPLARRRADRSHARPATAASPVASPRSAAPAARA